MEHLKSLLLDNNLHFPSPKDFNDPFDCNLPVVFKCSENELRDTLETEIKRLRPGLSQERINRQIRACFYARTLPRYQKNWKDYFFNKINASGILSFCETYNNFLLWSHYASKHTGICIEFNYPILHSLVSNIGLVNKIRYFRKPFKVPVYEDEGKKNDSGLMKVIFSKHIRWCYEKEWRLIIPEINITNPSRLISFPKEAIVKIILGINFPEEFKRNIVDIVDLKYSREILYEASINHDSFSLDIREFKSPWF